MSILERGVLAVVATTKTTAMLLAGPLVRL
jgi:hypothetical protein